MSVSNGYATVEDLRARLSVADTDDEQIFENVIEAASRAIDNYTHRRFWKDINDTTRIYTTSTPDRLRVDDLVSITTLKADENQDRVYESTWATTDYDLDPVNADLDNKPFTTITVAPLGRYTFPTGARAVQIVGKFGWPAVPDPINEATLIQAARIYRRKDSPFGVAGTAEFGQLRLLSRLDPDVELLVAPFRVVLVG